MNVYDKVASFSCLLLVTLTLLLILLLTCDCVLLHFIALLRLSFHVSFSQPLNFGWISILPVAVLPFLADDFS